MNYKNSKVLEINPVVYMGSEFSKNEWKENEHIFFRKIKNVEFNCNIGWECPIEDMIYVYVDYEDDFNPIPEQDTIKKILDTASKLITIFDNTKINLCIDGFVDNCNSFDLSIEEFKEYISRELDVNNKN